MLFSSDYVALVATCRLLLRPITSNATQQYPTMDGTMSTEMQKLLTPQQVADRLGLHVETVRRYCREDTLPHKRIGGKLYIPESAITVKPAA